MPVSPDTRRITLNLSAEQYKVLLDQAEAEGYITLLPDEANIKVTGGAVAEFLRNHLSWTIPGFMDAKPLPARGKYKRKKQAPKKEIDHALVEHAYTIADTFRQMGAESAAKELEEYIDGYLYFDCARGDFATFVEVCEADILMLRAGERFIKDGEIRFR